MPSPLDTRLLEALPAELRTAVEAQTDALAAERAARLHLDAEIADLRSRNAELAALRQRSGRSRSTSGSTSSPPSTSSASRSVALRYWVEAPRKGPEGWGARINITLLFPT